MTDFKASTAIATIAEITLSGRMDRDTERTEGPFQKALEIALACKPCHLVVRMQHLVEVSSIFVKRLLMALQKADANFEIYLVDPTEQPHYVITTMGLDRDSRVHVQKDYPALAQTLGAALGPGPR
jgi:hypothetical protein